MEVDETPTLEELAAIEDRAPIEEIAASLAEALQLEWEERVAVALALAAELSGQGASREEVFSEMGTELSVGMRRRSQPLARIAVELFYETGTREVGTPRLPQGQPAVQFAEEYTTFWIGNHYDRFVQERIRSLTDEAFQEGLGAFRRGARFAESALGQEFSKSQSYWELLSNASATRTRELAHIDEFERQGVEEVMIDAVIDSRTSEICRTLDGTRFSLAQLTEYRDDLLDTDSPADVKEASPWLPPERIRSLEAQGPEALAEAGVVSPPFHGHCRSRLSVPI